MSCSCTRYQCSTFVDDRRYLQGRLLARVQSNSVAGGITLKYSLCLVQDRRRLQGARASASVNDGTHHYSLPVATYRQAVLLDRQPRLLKQQPAAVWLTTSAALNALILLACAPTGACSCHSEVEATLSGRRQAVLVTLAGLVPLISSSPSAHAQGDKLNFQACSVWLKITIVQCSCPCVNSWQEHSRLECPGICNSGLSYCTEQCRVEESLP